MADNAILTPAAELAAMNKAQFPNESPEYRQARNALLAEEIELRRHIEHVAALRRALPPGGGIPEDYTFKGQDGTVRLSQLFGDKDTLVIYSWTSMATTPAPTSAPTTQTSPASTSSRASKAPFTTPGAKR
jgi:predicted dithiol-disulfide oxidoreductase (DUF899 family)